MGVGEQPTGWLWALKVLLWPWNHPQASEHLGSQMPGAWSPDPVCPLSRDRPGANTRESSVSHFQYLQGAEELLFGTSVSENRNY